MNNNKVAILLNTFNNNASDEEKLKILEHNTGNLLFWQSIIRLFNPDIISFNEYKKLKDYDRVIITDLIWIQENVSINYFDYIEEIIDKFDIPFIPISVGLQSQTYNPNFKLSPSVERILKKLEKRAVLGVRGYYTASILKKYNITNFSVIGCPSMYYWNNRNLKIHELRCPKKISGNFRTFYGKFTNEEKELLSFLQKNNAQFIEQTGFNLKLENVKDDELFKRVDKWLTQSKEMYYNYSSWSTALNNIEFSIGGRFHGNVMALHNNIKSLFIVSDSRTKEMTELFKLPAISISQFDENKDVNYYFSLANYSHFNKIYPVLFDNFVQFAKINGLEFDKNAIPLEFVPKQENLEEKECLSIMKEKIVLYYCKTVRQLFCSLILAKKEEPNVKKYLFVNAWLHNLFTNMSEKLCKKPFNFDKVVIYNSSHITNIATKEESKLISDIILYFDNLLEKNYINLDDITEFNIFSSLRFSVYLSEKKKHFNLFEDGNGTAITNGLVQWRNETDKVDKRKVAEKYGLLAGNSLYVKEIYTSIQSNLKKFPKDKIRLFDSTKELTTLSDKDINDLFVFFNDSNETELNESYDYMILTQFYDIETNLPKDVFWGLIADCYIPDNYKCSVKAHPADNTNFSNVFKNDKIFNKNIPFELVERCVDMKNTITITSTSTKNSNVNDVHLGKEFMSFNLLRYYALLYYLSENAKTIKFSYIGEHKNNFYQLLKNKFMDIEKNYLENIEQCDILICEDYSKYVEFIKKGNKNLIICKSCNSVEIVNLKEKIIKFNAKLGQDVILNEQILIYCVNNDLFEDIVNLEKVLSRTNIKISLTSFNQIEELNKEIKELNIKLNLLQEKVKFLEDKINSITIDVKFK